MNRPFIDLWTKQSLIMCGRAFNWGSETRFLLAKRMHGQEWGAFDWVLCHWGKGWGTTVTQPMPLDLPCSLLRLCHFSSLSLSASPFLWLLVSATFCLVPLSLCFQIRRKCPPSPHFPQLCVLLCHLLRQACLVPLWFSDLCEWQRWGSDRESGRGTNQLNMLRLLLFVLCLCIIAAIFLWYVQSSVSLWFGVVSHHEDCSVSLIMCKHNSPSLLTSCSIVSVNPSETDGHLIGSLREF